MATQTKVSARERERRASQAKVARGIQDEDEGALSIEAGLRVALDGVDVTDEKQLDEIDAALAVVNLDELYDEPFTVAYRAYVEEEIEDEDGSKRIRRRPVSRSALLDPMVPAELQLKAMGLNRSKNIAQVERLNQMIDLVVEAWNRTEPGMTRQKLLAAMDIERISAIFKRLFNPATRH